MHIKNARRSIPKVLLSWRGLFVHFSGTQQEILDELKAEGKLKDKPAKKEISKTIQAIHQMSVREMRKALEQQAQMGNVTIAEPTPAAKKRTTRKAVGKGGRG